MLDGRSAGACPTGNLLNHYQVCFCEGFHKPLLELSNPPKMLISASAIGYYGDTGIIKVNEQSDIGSGFFSELCKDWEQAALKAERESQSQSSTTSSEYSSEAELTSSISKLEEYLVETAEHFKKEMMHYMTDISCAAKTNNTTKYNKEAATKVRKAVADFLIDTFEITSPL